MFTCKIDNRTFATEIELHSHISRSLKVKLEVYYAKYFPRRDRHTGELIDFKSKDFYFHSLFNTRANMVNYFKSHALDTETFKKCIDLRRKSKQLISAPSTVESRTCILPTPSLARKMDIDYNKLCLELGLASRFDYSQTKLEVDDAPLSVIVDTREQNPIIFDNDVSLETSKLDFGDYVSTSHYDKVFIERKSLTDLCGTLSKGYERFNKEVERALSMDSYLVVCVEEKLQNLLSLPYLPHTKHIQASTDFLCHRLREICQKFPNIQFLFFDGRRMMNEKIPFLLRLGGRARGLDLQFYQDIGVF